MLFFFNKYINLDSLCSQGLNEDEAKEILVLHELSDEAMSAVLNIDKKALETLKFVEIFSYLKKLSVKKVLFKATAIKTFDISDWLNNLPFKPTDDQLKALDDIRGDLSQNLAAKRVIISE